MDWHPSHQIFTPREGEEHCTKCGLHIGKDRLQDHSEYAPQPCNPTHWYKDGLTPYFIPPEDIDPMPTPEQLRKLKRFWNPYMCTCDPGHFSVGYRLARHRNVGDFCIACDSEFITSKHHCHCAICGGVDQVG